MFELPTRLDAMLGNFKLFVSEKAGVKQLVQKSHELLNGLVAAAMDLEEDGATKKSYVLTAFGNFYDNVIANAPIPWVPAVVSKKLFAYLRPIAMELASVAIEDAYNLLKKAVVK